MTEYELRNATPDDADATARLLRDAFGAPEPPDPADSIRTVIEPSRNHVMVHGGRIVANAGAFTRDLAVPGAVLPAAHVTMVAVEATHTRRGLLRRMMDRQLHTVPEAIAVLWASEGRIYQRFGYGLATRNVSLTIQSREVSLRPGTATTEGTLRSAVPADVRKELSEVYAQVLPQRPGMSGRNEMWWTHLTNDPESRRGGLTALRAVLHERPDGVADGYALWRVRNEWGGPGPKHEAVVEELVAGSPAAHAALWRLLLGIDLTRTATLHLGSVDDPLFHLVDEPRRLGATISDGLWLRIVDLPRALTSRRYAAPVDVVLEVTDALLTGNAGRWRLRVGAGGALVNVARVTDPADLTCDIADLGAAYLGGTPLSALARAGRVREHRPGTVAATSTAFGWHVTPASIEVF